MPRPADLHPADHACFVFNALVDFDGMAPSNHLEEAAIAASYLYDHLAARHASVPSVEIFDCFESLLGELGEINGQRAVAGDTDPWPAILAALEIPDGFWWTDPPPSGPLIRAAILSRLEAH